MTNHNPTITSPAATASFSENAGTTGSTALHAVSGTMNFTDQDHSDTHTTSVTLKNAVLSSGTVIPASTLSDLNAAMTSSILSDSNGSGKLKWAFDAQDDDFDFLSKNQTLTLTYQITLADNHGGSTTKNVTITVTGTDDKPIVDFGTTAVVNEQDNLLLSLSPDTAHVAVNFTDPDLTNTGHTATIVDASASGATDGLLPGALGEAELMSFYHVDNVVKVSGSSSGTINTTFTAPDLAFDYLSAGQTLDITYTLKIDDHQGGITTQTVDVIVVGANDAPIYLSPSQTAHLTEDHNLSPAGNLTAHGDLFFTDVDLADIHTTDVTVTATRSGVGGIPLSNADLQAAFTTTTEDSTGHVIGEFDWDFSLANSAVNFLSGGETLTITYTVPVIDNSGASDVRTVTITILGVNHPVMITSGPESASLSEQADTTGSATLDTTQPVPTGTLAFTDQDLSDAHTVQVSVDSTIWVGGSVPADTLTALDAALQTTLNDSMGTGSGGVDWTFSIPDNNLDFLAANETLTVTYDVTVKDASTAATQTVTVAISGANDAPAIVSGPESASLAELLNTAGSSQIDSTTPVPTGTLAFSDVDLTDTHQVSVALESAVWSDPSFAIPFSTLDALQTALTTALHDSTGSGSGGVDWSFSIADQQLDFLGGGDTLTVTYDVAVSDALANSTQTVTVTITGAEDPGVVNPVTAAAFDTPFQDTAQVIASGNVLLDAGDSGGDLNNALTVTDVNGDPGGVGILVAGTYGDLLLESNGFYAYFANAFVDPLQVGDNVTDQFNFTVTDTHGHSVTTTLTIDVVGTDDAPFITGGQPFGSVVEDAGPSAISNGDFENGTLAGWTASGDVTATFVGIGGELGNYAAKLGPGLGSISQDIVTTPGQHYTLSFFVAGDPESTTNDLTVTWDGTTIAGVTDDFGAFVRHTFDVVGDATSSTTPLVFSFTDDGTGLLLDQVLVTANTGPATESTAGNLSFSDIEAGDTHTASFSPLGSGYLGTFSLDPLTESSGAGSVDWHFTVDNSDIQFLSEGQSLTQDYLVSITGDQGASVSQIVSVTMIGSNDAPTAVNDTVISDLGGSGVVEIPSWTLALNDTDPDAADHLTFAAITGSSGGSAVQFGDTFFIDDATPGGSFEYTVGDGHTTSANAATASVVNDAAVTALTGTPADEILIGNNGAGETLSGGGGRDALIGWGGGYVMTGGSGDDIFGLQSSSDALNTITDFNNVSANDKVAISAAGYGLTPGQDPAAVFENSDDDQFVFANFHYDNANQTLYYSPDGTTASAHAVAVFQADVLLHASDLMIV